ncbi:MAG: NAD-dependent epimerase/dehydratase family protein [Gammaproteobacteria bacterium]
MKIFITGGAGFIGSHLVEYHLNKGDEVSVVDDLSTGKIEHIDLFKHNKNFTFAKGDILTWDGMDDAVTWADRIYHMAAVVGVYRVISEPIHVLETNIAGSERILKAVVNSGKKPRILMASSSEVYGNGMSDTFRETDDVIIEPTAESRWNYPISKLADEAMSLSYVKEKGLAITPVRLFNVIGPRQTGRYGMVVPRFVKQAVAGEPITVYGTGNQTRSFCDVRDIVVMFDTLISTDKSIGQIVNVGNDHELSINTLADIIRSKVNPGLEIKHIPYKEAYGQDYKDIQRRRPNLEKLMSLIQFEFKWTLDETLDYLIEHARGEKL